MPTIFFLARHEDRKGLAVLLEAFAGLDTRCALWLGGVGPETSRLRRRYEGDPRISWLGEIDDDEKVRRMRSADVFCAPSLHGESFGIVLLEAMAAETAVIASALSGYRRVVECPNGRIAGLLTRPGSVEELRAGLAHLLADESSRQALVEIGSDRVTEFSMARLADLYVAAYQRLLPGSTTDL